MTTCTRPKLPRLQTALPRLELAAEQSRIELGYRAAIEMEIEHIRPDLIRHRADTAVRIARAREAAAWAAVAAAYGREPVVYLLHFDRLYMPYPGAPLRDCAGHYSSGLRIWRPGSRVMPPAAAPGSWRSYTRPGSPGTSHVSGPGRGNANGSSSGRAARAAAARCAGCRYE